MLQGIDLSAYLEEQNVPVLEVPVYEKTTLAELGNRLPIGVPTGPVGGRSFARAFHFDKLTTRRERELDRLRSEKGGAGTHPGKTVMQIVAQMLLEWGGDDTFSEETSTKKLLAVQNAYMEDVLYAWIYFRIQTLGPILVLKPECSSPTCRTEWDWATDLRGLEVTSAPNGVEAAAFKLMTPVLWTSTKRNISALVLEPPKWGALADIQPNSVGFADTKIRLALSAVVGVITDAGDEYPLVPGMLDEMDKSELERLAEAVDGLFPGTDPRFELVCPTCSNKQVTALNWAWDFFFTSASTPSALKRS